jgi:glutaredoxin 2
MNNEKIEELLEAIKHLERQVSRLSERLGFYEHILRRYGLPPFPPIDEEEIEIWLRKWGEYRQKEGVPLERWMKENREAIVSTSKIIQRLEISPQDATLHFCSYLMDTTSYLAAKSLLGSCECGGQLQLLVKDDTIYITCAKCGRWLWQGLKHE